MQDNLFVVTVNKDGQPYTKYYGEEEYNNTVVPFLSERYTKDQYSVSNLQATSPENISEDGQYVISAKGADGVQRKQYSGKDLLSGKLSTITERFPEFSVHALEQPKQTQSQEDDAWKASMKRKASLLSQEVARTTGEIEKEASKAVDQPFAEFMAERNDALGNFSRMAVNNAYKKVEETDENGNVTEKYVLRTKEELEDFQKEREAQRDAVKAERQAYKDLEDIKGQISKIDEQLAEWGDHERNVEDYYGEHMTWLVENAKRKDALLAERAALTQKQKDNPYYQREDRRLKEVADKVTADAYKVMSKMDVDGELITPSDPEANIWQAAKYFADQANKTLGAPDDSQNGFVAFLQGHGATFSDTDFWLAGLESIASNMTVRKQLEKIGDKINNYSDQSLESALSDGDLDDLLTDAEKALLLAFASAGEAQSLRAQNTSNMYNAGITAANSLGFMAQFILTQGVGSSFASSMKKGAKGLASWLAKNTGKVGAAVTDMAASAGSTLVGRGAMATADALATPFMKAIPMTLMQTGLYNDYARKLTERDENGNMKYDYDSAVLPALRDAGLEVWSEMALEPVLSVMGKVGGTIMSKAAGQSPKMAMMQTKLGDLAKLVNNRDAMKILVNAGFDGYLEEIGEEILAAGVSSIWDKDAWSEFWQKDNLTSMAVAFAPMSVLGAGASMANYTSRVMKYDEVEPKMKELLKPYIDNGTVLQEEVDAIFNRSVNTLEEVGQKINDIIAPVVKSGNITSEEFRTLFDFSIATAQKEMANSLIELNRQDRRRYAEKDFTSSAGGRDLSGKDAEGNRTMSYYTDEDGNRRYVKLDMSRNDGLALSLNEKGGDPKIVDVNNIELTTSSYDGFLDEWWKGMSSTAEKERMAEDSRKQRRGVVEALKDGKPVRLYNPETNLREDYIFLGWNGQNAIVANAQSGAEEERSIQELANGLNVSASVMTDAQKEQAQVDEIVRNKSIARTANEYKGRQVNFRGVNGTLSRVVSTADENGVPMLTMNIVTDEGITPVQASFNDIDSFIAEQRTLAEEGRADAHDRKVARRQSEEADRKRSEEYQRSKADYTNADGSVREGEFLASDPRGFAMYSDGKYGKADTDATLRAQLEAAKQRAQDALEAKEAEANPETKQQLRKAYEEAIAKMDTIDNVIRERNKDRSSEGALSPEEAREKYMEYEAMGLTPDEIYDLAMKSAEEVRQTIDAMPKPELTSDVQTYIDQKKAYEKAVEEEKKKISYWESIVNSPMTENEKQNTSLADNRFRRRMQDIFNAQAQTKDQATIDLLEKEKKDVSKALIGEAISGINTNGTPFIVSTEASIFADMKKAGCSEKSMNDVREAVESGTIVNGFFDASCGTIFFIAENTMSMREAQVVFTHEDQHRDTAENNLAQALLDRMGIAFNKPMQDRLDALRKREVLTPEEQTQLESLTKAEEGAKAILIPELRKMVRNEFYDGKSVLVIADELISFAKENQFVGRLESLALEPTIANFVENIDNEREKARTNTAGVSQSGVAESGGSTFRIGDLGNEPAQEGESFTLGEQGSGSAEGSAQADQVDLLDREQLALPLPEELSVSVPSYDTGVTSMASVDDGVRFNIATEPDVLKAVREFASSKDGKKLGWTPQQIEEIAQETTDLLEFIHESISGDPHYDAFAMKQPTIRVDWRDGKERQTVTWHRNNIEYKFDMSSGTYCINNEGIETILSMPVMVDLILHTVDFSKYTTDDYLTLYETLRDMGIVVPCKGCFDAAARIKMLPSVAQNFAELVNQVIDERNTDPEAFDKAIKAMPGQKTESGFPAGAANKLDAIRIGVAGDNLTEHISFVQLLSAEGQTKALADWGGIFRAWQRTGAGRPKDKLMAEPYTGVIMTRSSTIIAPYGEKTPSFRDKEVNMGTGLRRNSHDEFRIETVVDEIQFMRDAWLKGLRVFKYMKELDDVRLFGKMGVKFNMSGFPGWLEGAPAAGLDNNGGYYMSEESVGGREFPSVDENGKTHYDGSKGLEEAKKYINEDVSLSSVIMSVPHFIKALTDIPTPSDKSGTWGSIIPFHASGATAHALEAQGLGKARGVQSGTFMAEAFTDYDKGVTNFEDVQNDRFGEGWRILLGKKAGTDVGYGHKMEYANGTVYRNDNLGITLYASTSSYKAAGGTETFDVKGAFYTLDSEGGKEAHGLSIDYNDKVREIGTKYAYKEASDYYVDLLRGIGLLPRFDFSVPKAKFLEMCADAHVDPHHPKLGWKGDAWSPVDAESYYALWCDYGMTDPATGELSPHRPVLEGKKDAQDFIDALPENYVEIIREGLSRYTNRRGFEDSITNEAIVEYCNREIASGKMEGETVRKILADHGVDDSNLMFRTTEISPEVQQEMEVIKAQARLDGSFLKAPNGEKSNLSEENWAMVRTNNFKQWFGDWENDPENASKVVDENGEPRVVYRGDDSGRNILDGDIFFIDSEYAAASYSNGEKPEYAVYLDIKNPLRLTHDNCERVGSTLLANSDKSVVKIYKDAINAMPEDWSLEVWGKPIGKDMVLENVVKEYEGIEYIEDKLKSMAWEPVIEYAKKHGNDGIFATDQSADLLQEYIPSYITFSPNQIKSATDNTGAFSAEEPDIRFSVRGREMTNEASTRFRILEKGEEPKKTIPVYKLMRLGADGNVYPLFIDRNAEPILFNKWYGAEVPNIEALKTLDSGFAYLLDRDGNVIDTKPIVQGKQSYSKLPSKDQVASLPAGQRWMVVGRYADGEKAYYNVGINGADGVGLYALRPGWHAGKLPSMWQIGKGVGKNLRDDSFVWVRGEMAADTEYKKGDEGMSTKGDMPFSVPTGGYYAFMTNPKQGAEKKAKKDAEARGETYKGNDWYVGSAFMPVEVISDAEARRVIDEYNKENNTAVPYDFKRESGKEFNAETMQLEDASVETRFRVTPQQDADYLTAVESGDMEKAQQMVDEVADKALSKSKVRGKDGKILTVYHGTKGGSRFTVFDTYNSRKRDKGNMGSHFGPEGTAEEFNGGNMYKVFLDLRKPYEAPFDFFADNYNNAYLSVLLGMKRDMKSDAAAKEFEKIYDVYPILRNYDVEELNDGAVLEEFDGDENLEEMEVRTTKLGEFRGPKYLIEHRNAMADIMRGMMKAEGYDGFVYENWYEGEDNNECYVALYPNQIKSADPVTYDNEGNVIPLSKRFNTEEDDIRFRTVYHGSASDFEKFDHEFMSTGEGYQSYGWGSYVSELNDVAVAYAKASVNRAAWDGKKEYTPKDVVAIKIRNRMEEDGLTFDEAKKLLLDEVGDLFYGESKYYTKEDLENFTEDELGKYGLRHLYDVEIPDDNGGNYLHWDEPLKRSQVKKIKDALKAMPNLQEEYGEYLNEEINSAFSDGILGKHIEGSLNYFLGNKYNYATGVDEGAERNSKFLNGLGFVGMQVPVNYTTNPSKGASNYVIYNENDLNVTDHVRFRTANENQQIFVSNAMQAVDAIQQGKATPAQWLGMLQSKGGLKAGEDKWLGLSEWLNDSDKKTLTKDEVKQFIADNMIQIEEQDYSEDADLDAAIQNDIKQNYGGGMELWELQAEIDEHAESASRYDMIGNANGEELDIWLMDTMVQNYGDSFSEGYDIKDGIIEYYLPHPWDIEESEVWNNFEGIRGINEIRLDYVTKGLRNNREIALTIPTIDPWNTDDNIHFGDAGNGRAVAWIRFGETETPSGRILVIDEIQSKRHQEGREKGYYGAPREFENSTKGIRHAFDDMSKKYGDQFSVKYDWAFGNGGPYDIGLVDKSTYERIGDETLQEEFWNLQMKYEGENIDSNTGEIPDAPFEKNWHELSMKRMLRLAAEEGYDKVAWTNGDMQAERYDIGTLVDSVRRNGNTFTLFGPKYGQVSLTVDDNGIIKSSTMMLDQKDTPLSEVVGKDLASKMLEMSEDEVFELKGKRVGGEGMKGFYDKILPAFMNKYGKKWGVKVQDIDLPGLQNENGWHSIDVTPDMKESVMNGQTMFRTADMPFAQDTKAKSLANIMRTWSVDEMGAEIRDYLENRTSLYEELGKSPADALDYLLGLDEKAYKDATRGEFYGYKPSYDELHQMDREDAEAFAEDADFLLRENLESRKLTDVKWLKENAPELVNAVEYTGRNSGAEGQIRENLGLDETAGVDTGSAYINTDKLGGEETRFRTIDITPETRDEMQVIEAQARINDTYLKAPNGATTNLNEEQWSMVRTKAFKSWFGDWENDPANASKVVDENGEPRVVYHGTIRPEFYEFDSKRTRHNNELGSGFYFTDDLSIARRYTDPMMSDNSRKAEDDIYESYIQKVNAFKQIERRDPDKSENSKLYREAIEKMTQSYRKNAHVMPVFLNIRNPYENEYLRIDRSTLDEIESKIESGRNDGIIDPLFKERHPRLGNIQYVAFSPEQIKSATDNNGGFDPNDGDIRFRAIPGGESMAERTYRETGAFSFTGSQKVNSIADVAFIFRELENRATENSFIVMVKDGVPTILHTGIGDIASTTIDATAAVAGYNDFFPDTVFMVHNHPSGYLFASKADKAMLQTLSDIFKGIPVGGIILDTVSGNFGYFDKWAESKHTMPEEGEEFPVKVMSFDKMVFDKEFRSQMNDRKVTGPEDVASFLSAHRLGDGNKMGVLLMNHNNVIVANYVTNDNSLGLDNAGRIARQVADVAVHNGAEGVIMFGNFNFDVTALKRFNTELEWASGHVIDLRDIVQKTQDGKYVSIADGNLKGRADGVMFRITPEQDADYRKAYEEGDAETATQMVKAAFKAAYPDTKVVDENGDPLVVYHGTVDSFFTFDKDKTEFGAFHFSESERSSFEAATNKLMYEEDEDREKYRDDVSVMPVFLNIRNISDVTDSQANDIALGRSQPVSGADGYKYTNEVEDKGSTSYMVFNPSQIKSAEPFTFDDKGELIPLSERFNPESDDIRFSIVGEKAASLDKTREGLARMSNLEVAREMEAQLKPDWMAKDDANAIKIKVATGWERGADNLWRYEVEDVKMKPFGSWLMSKKKLKLKDIVEDGTVMQLYPQFKDIDIIKKTGKYDVGGSFSREHNTIKLPFGAMKDDINRYGVLFDSTLREFGLTLIHEIQHAIQNQEGFARGGSPSMLTPRGEFRYNKLIDEMHKVWEEFDALPASEKKSTNPKAMLLNSRSVAIDRQISEVLRRDVLGLERYKRLSGEVESGNVEKRSTMSEEERRNTLLSFTEDVAREDQIVFFNSIGEAENLRVPDGNDIRFRLPHDITRQKGETASDFTSKITRAVMDKYHIPCNVINVYREPVDGSSAAYSAELKVIRTFVRPNIKYGVVIEHDLFHESIHAAYDKIGKLSDATIGDSIIGHPSFEGLRESIQNSYSPDMWLREYTAYCCSEMMSTGDFSPLANASEDEVKEFDEILKELRYDRNNENLERAYIREDQDRRRTEKERNAGSRAEGSSALFRTSGILGSDYSSVDRNTFFDDTYDKLPAPIMREVVSIADDNGYDFSDAIMRYFADLAEKSEFTPEELDAIEVARKALARTLEIDEGKVQANDLLWTIYDDVHKADPGMDSRIYNQKVKRALGEAPSVEGDMTLQDYLDAAAKSRDDLKAQYDAMKALAYEVNEIGKALGSRANYDRQTVGKIVSLCRSLLESHLLDTMTNGEVKRLMGVIRRTTGMRNISSRVSDLYNLILSNHLRNLNNMLEKEMKRKATKVNSNNVIEQSALDINGQHVMEAFKGNMDSVALDGSGNMVISQKLADKISDALDRVDSEDKETSDKAAMELMGLSFARQYIEGVKASESEEDDLRQAMADAEEKHKAGKMDTKIFRQFMKEQRKALVENKAERVGALSDLLQKMQDMAAASHTLAIDFVVRNKERINGIHHDANRDMKGTADTEHPTSPTFFQKVSNNPFVQFFFRPLSTFDQMLRMFGNKSVNGEGFLWNRYMRGWIDANGAEFKAVQDAFQILDKKVSEVFGRKMVWSDLYAVEKGMPKATVSFFDGGELKDHELTQGNLLYIMLADQMTDGRMKLRNMGISEQEVDAIRDQMDPRFIQLADWIVNEFLPSRREAYNTVYERMYGASMSKVENYFPLKVLANARTQQVDVASANADPATPSTVTGSIMKRTRNALALDVIGTDAFSEVIDHVQKMEHWAAFAEWNRDLSDLLSYKRFRNQVQNMTSIYGSQKNLWSEFVDASMIASGSYVGKTGKLDPAFNRMAKGVTAAKISLRVFTALKQFLSFPAYFSEVGVRDLVPGLTQGWGWCMENLPMFEKRWKSRQAGDHILAEGDLGKINEAMARVGMYPNALVDAYTVSSGAYAIYRKKNRQYLAMGFSQAAADKRAKQDAVIFYNETQQSSEAAFMSSMQAGRSTLEKMFTVFRNSSMGYQRQVHDALRNFKRRLTPGYRAESISFMTKQLIDEGLEDFKALRAAKSLYARQGMKDALRLMIFGYGLQFFWNLASYIPYLIFGDDDDKKEEMLMNAGQRAVFGSLEGLTGGNLMSEALDLMVSGEGLGNWDPSLLPIVSDFKNLYQQFGKDNVRAVNDLINLGVQALVGVNPQTLEDGIVAVIDACNGDLGTSKEALMLALRLINAPQGSLDQLYIDEIDMNALEAKNLTIPELAKRYSDYKKMKGAGAMYPLYSFDEDLDRKVTDKYLNRFNTIAKERLSGIEVADRYATMAEEAKAMSDRVKSLRALAKDGDQKAEQELMQIFLSPDYGRLLRFGEMAKEVDGYVKDAVTAPTRDELVRNLTEAENVRERIVNDFDGDDGSDSWFRDRFTQYTKGILPEMARLDKKYSEEYGRSNPDYEGWKSQHQKDLDEAADRAKSNAERVAEINEELKKYTITLPNGKKRYINKAARKRLIDERKALTAQGLTEKSYLNKLAKGYTPEDYMPASIYNSPEFKAYLSVKDLGYASGTSFQFKTIQEWEKKMNESDSPETKEKYRDKINERMVIIGQQLTRILNEIDEEDELIDNFE